MTSIAEAEVRLKTTHRHCPITSEERNVRQGIEWEHVLRTATLLAVLMMTALVAEAAERVTLEFELQELDLASGLVSAADLLIDPTTPAGDIRIAHNASVTPSAVVVPAVDGVEIAVLASTAYETVTASAIPSASFSAEAPAEPLYPEDTVLVKTATGAVYKLGNGSESDVALSFDYEALQ